MYKDDAITHEVVLGLTKTAESASFYITGTRAYLVGLLPLISTPYLKISSNATKNRHDFV